jgi:hypothetical protein
VIEQKRVDSSDRYLRHRVRGSRRRIDGH